MLKKLPKNVLAKIPNILSSARIVFSISLFLIAGFLKKPEGWITGGMYIFIFIYLVAGLTDVFDGIIARKYKVESSLGEKLDGIGDVAMILAALICTTIIIKPDYNPKDSYMFIFVAVALGLRLFNALFARYKFKIFNNIHTVGTKLLGGFAYLIVAIFIILHRYDPIAIIVVSIIAIITISEETLILATAKEYDVNRKGYFRDGFFTEKFYKLIKKEPPSKESETKCTCGCQDEEKKD